MLALALAPSAARPAAQKITELKILRIFIRNIPCTPKWSKHPRRPNLQYTLACCGQAVAPGITRIRTIAAASPRRGLRSALGGCGLHGAGVLALGLNVAIDELDHRHGGIVAGAEPRLHDPRIAAIPILVARTQHVDQLLDQIGVAQARNREPTRVQVAALAKRYQLFDHRAKVFGLWQGGRDLLVLDERLRHIGEHRLAMLGGAIESPLGVSVVHLACLLFGSAAAVPWNGRSLSPSPFGSGLG